MLKFPSAMIAALVIAVAPRIDVYADGNSVSPHGYDRIADILFPEAHDWQRVDDLPVVTASELGAQLLEQMFSKKSGVSVADDIGCSFRGRMMHLLGLDQSLRRGDVFGPGDDDLVYVGPNPCGEGQVSIIWRHVHDPSKMSGIIWSAELIIKLSSGGRIIDLEQNEGHGTYYISASNSVKERSVDVFDGLEIPAKAVPARGRVVFKQPGLLHWWPGVGVANTRLSEYAEDDGLDAKGETYDAGTRAEVLLSYHDASNRLWRLVRVPEPSTSHSTVGWISD